MDKHTPGPWYSHYATAVAEQADGEDMDAFAITDVSEEDYVRTGSRGNLIAFAPYETVKRGKANAGLLAAAPEMLVVIERLRAALRANGAPNCEAMKESGALLDALRAAK